MFTTSTSRTVLPICLRSQSSRSSLELYYVRLGLVWAWLLYSGQKCWPSSYTVPFLYTTDPKCIGSVNINTDSMNATSPLLSLFLIGTLCGREYSVSTVKIVQFK